MAVVVVVTNRAADVFFVALASVPFGFAGPVDLTSCAAMSKVSNSHIKHLLL